MDVTGVPEQLDLGRPLRPPTVLKDDEQNPVWRVETDSGPWVVKVLQPWGDFWLRMAAQSGSLEAAAWESGMAMPEPHTTVLGEAGLWRPVGGGRYARAVRFVEGAHPEPPASEALAGWIGGAVARLARLGVPSDPTVDGDYKSHPREEWDDWFEEAERLRTLSADEVRRFRHAVDRAEAMVAANRDLWEKKQVMHRDLRFPNLLIGADGPVLLDFDAAGAQLPWWELVQAAFQTAGFGDGSLVPERRIVAACVAGYADAGGEVGPADESAFAGMFAGRVGAATWQMWMASGHRGGSPEFQAGFGRMLRESVAAMDVTLKSLPEWSGWLAA
ncbi:phosphotransferase enzyme family protein [Glycomyces mayteni]|uniref:Phosphotransferase enzyme family protein n=1 Tax=Glycomyces mayteni TaxID=543887 RepID=A0ABW2D520_9ACTN